MGSGRWQLWIPGYAVMGTVDEANGENRWEARTMTHYTPEGICGPPFHGRAPTLNRAKRLVEVLLMETDTLTDNGAALRTPVDPYADQLAKARAERDEFARQVEETQAHIRNIHAHLAALPPHP